MSTKELQKSVLDFNGMASCPTVESAPAANAFGWQGAPSFNGAALQKCGRFTKPAVDLPVPERTRVVLRQFFIGVLPPSEIALRNARVAA